MIKKKIYPALTVLLFTVTTAALTYAQTGAVFVGTWNQNMEKSATKSSWLKSYTNKIAIDGDKLVITTLTVGNRGERSYERTYTLGKEVKSQDRDGDEFTTNVKIEGRSLIFDTVEKERDSVLTNHEIWTVSEDGKTMTKVLKRSGGPRGDSEQQFLFEKQT